MKNLSIYLLLIFLNSDAYPQSNYSEFNHFMGVQINTGITFFDLAPLKDNFNSYVNVIKGEYNIPLEVQRLYPANISWSFYLFWYFSPNASLIIGPEYTSTRAFSRYQDYAGTLDIKSEIKEIYLSFGIRVHFPDVKIVQPFVGVNAGFADVRYNDEIDLNINGVQLDNNYNKSSDGDYGYIIEPNIGFNYDIKFAVIEFIASYRYMNLDRFIINPDNINLRIGIQKGVFK
jgi:hypothetical protein